jgi:hypothetical protein
MMYSEVPQNFMYTSKATEMGRGKKCDKISDAPTWTPGPGAYNKPTEFERRTEMKQVFPNTEGQEETL